jgi:hypothetical protein
MMVSVQHNTGEGRCETPEAADHLIASYFSEPKSQINKYSFIRGQVFMMMMINKEPQPLQH